MNIFISALLSLIIYFIYFSGVFSFTKELRGAIIKNTSLFSRVVYTLGLLLPGIILLLLLKNERFIYYWDYAGYWFKSIDFTKLYFENPFAAMKQIYSSINHDEYNTLPNLLLTPANKILGLSFGSYVFSIYLIYCLPFALLLSSLIIKLYPDTNQKLKLLLPYIIIFFTPCLIPMRYGFVDVAGLVFIALVLSIFVSTNYFRNLNIKQAVITGILMLLLIFTRRWYAFWFVAFYCTAFLINFIYSIRAKSFITIKNTCINLFIAGIIPTVIMLVLFFPFFKMSVLKDYSDIYSAYRQASLLHQLNVSNLFFGSLILIISGLGLIKGIIEKRTLFYFLFISTSIIVVLFIRVNDFGGLQHYYLLVPLIIVGFIKGTMFLYKHNKVIGLACFAMLLVNNYFVFGYNTPEKKVPLFSSIEGQPIYRSDYYEIDRMANVVNELHEKGKGVYCLASNDVLNNDILKNIKLPDINNSIFKLLPTEHVDKRDRFPNALFLADYVIVTDPVALHLGEDNQQVISYFNNQILNGFLKDHYTTIEKFPLKNSTTAILLRKDKAVSNEEVEIMRNHFKNLYPDYPNMYNINTSITKSINITRGDGYGEVRFDGDETLFLFPGNGRESTISFQVNEKEKFLTFTATFDNKDVLSENCNPAKDGEVYLTIYKDGVLEQKLYITHKKDSTITLSVENSKIITLSADKGKNEDYCDWFKLTHLHFH